jgi:hypothetical protein
MLVRAHSCCLFLPTRVCLDETDFFLIRLSKISYRC